MGQVGDGFGLRQLLQNEATNADGVDVVCVLTEWPEFAKIDLDALAHRAGKGTTIVDTRNLLDPAAMRRRGFSYVGVGR